MKLFLRSVPASVERQRVWNFENILASAEQLASRLGELGIKQLDLELAPPTLRSSAYDDLEFFLSRLAFLEVTESGEKARSAFLGAAGALEKNEVRWGISRLDFLWDELLFRLSRAEARAGRGWLAGFCRALQHRELRLKPLVPSAEAMTAPPDASVANFAPAESLLTGDWLRDREEMRVLSRAARDDRDHRFQLAICEYLLTREPAVVWSETSQNALHAAEARLLGLYFNDSVLMSRLSNFATLARSDEKARAFRPLDSIEKTLQQKAIGPAEWVQVGRWFDRFAAAGTSPRSRCLALAWLQRAVSIRRNSRLGNFLLKSYLEIAGPGRDPYRLLDFAGSDGEIPRTVFDRSASILNLTSAVIAVLGRERLHGLFRSRRLHLASSERRQALELVAVELGRLKGPLMKLGQMASYLTDDLNDDEKVLFEFLWSNAPALSFSKLREQLDPAWLRKVKSIDPVPIGTGSVSQVHRATLDGDDQVAVKILLPDIKDLVASDTRLLKTVLPIAKVLAPGMPLKEICAEIDEKLLRETDLRAEARAMANLSERFQRYPDIHLPRVYPELSGEKMLVMSFERGFVFNDFLKVATSEERDRAGAAIVRFVVTSVRDRFFSADPHPGNFLFNGPRVTFLDFGSFVDWDSRTSRAWNMLIMAFLRYDFALYLEALESLGCIEPRAKKSDLREIFDVFAKPQAGFWNTGEFCALDARVTTAQLRQLMTSFGRRSPVRLYPKFLFGLRIYLGHLNVVARLGARHNWTELVASIFDQAAARDSSDSAGSAGV